MNIKNEIIAFLAIVVVVLTWGFYSQHSKILSLKSKMGADSAKISIVTNKYNEAVGKIAAAEVDKATFKDQYQKDLTYIKSHLGINKNDVQGIIQAAFQSHYEDTTHNVTVEHIIDTLHHLDTSVYSASDSSGWLRISANIAPNFFHYKVDTYDSVIFVPSLVSQGFLKPKRLFVSGLNKNPHSHITGLNYVEVKNYKHKRFAVTAGASVGVTTTGFVILPTVNVGFKLFEF